MGAPDHEGKLASLLDAFNARRFSDYVAGFYADAVIEYPQSGERIHGRDTMLGMFTAFAAPPTFRVWRTEGAGDIVVVHAAVHYPGTPEPWFALIEFQFVGDLIARETAHFAAPFAPADWRTPFVRVASFVPG
jgi:hypothetical protein